MRQRGSFGIGPCRQRGAAAVFAAVALIGILLSLMLVIEMGRIYLADRQLDKLASLAALDSARLLSGCGTLPAEQQLTEAVNASLTRNNRSNSPIRSVQIVFGTVATDSNTGLRRLQPSDISRANAIRIDLTAPMPTLITGFFPNSGRILKASATAQQPAVGNFSVGSAIARVDPSILNAMLTALGGGNVALTAVDYERLARVQLSAEQLALAFNLHLNDLSNPVALQTRTPVLSEALNGLADAAGRTANSSVVSVLRLLAAAASGNHNAIPLAEVLGQVPNVAPAVPFLNLLDLVMALEGSTRADSSGTATPIAIPVTVSIPNVTTMSAFIQILSPAQPSGSGRPGQTSAKTAAVRILLRMQVNARDNIQAALDPVLESMGYVRASPFNLGVDIELARAVAYLDELGCPTPEIGPVARLSALPALGRLSVGTFSGTPSSIPPLSTNRVQVLGFRTRILGGLVSEIRTNVFLDGPVSVNIGAGSSRPLPQPVTEFTPRQEPGRSRPYWEADRPVVANPQTVGSSELLRGALSSAARSLRFSAEDPDRPDRNILVCLRLNLCVPVGDILDSVVLGIRVTTDPVLTQASALDRVLSSLTESLGVQAGTATVTMGSVSVNPPRAVSKESVPTSP